LVDVRDNGSTEGGSGAMFKNLRCSIGILVALLAGTALVSPANAADYYAGKTIEIVAGSTPGAGIDYYARLVGRHLQRHIPGNPAIVVKNMPGASGTRAAQYVAMVAPNNGLTIGATTPGAIVGPLLDDKVDASFNPSEFIYLGTSNVGVGICTTMNTSKTRTFEDALKQKTILGAQGPGALSYDFAYLVKNLTGAQFNIVTGYNGSAHFTLAMERGEIDGVCGWNWSGARSQKPHWIKDKSINLLMQLGMDEHPELTQLGVPPIWKFISGDVDRKIAEFMLTQRGFERPLLVRAGTPPEQVSTLRTAFDATMRDPQFLAEAEKGQAEISPLPGARVQELVRAFYATPKDIVEKGRQAIRP
jgi:tripartite-type tricarboxylate transporter receptor subunit TctC